MADKYSFGRPARDLYERLSRSRDGVLQKARELAEISIPTLFPPDGYEPGDRLPPPNQSINSRCLNSLASKLMLTAAPPGKPILKFNILEHRMQDDIDANPELYAMVDQGLQRREEAHRKRLEATNIRSALTLAFKQLLGGGNILWQHEDINQPVVHMMDKYVVKRTKNGFARDIILKETVEFMDLEGSDRQFVRLVQKQNGTEPKTKDPYDETVDIYTCQRWDIDTHAWYYWQEYEGQMLPDSEVEIDGDDAPILYAAWLIPRFGHNWGGSYSEEYEGDMYIVENHQGSLNDGAEFAALLYLFLRPGAPTSKKTIEEARNGKVLTGVNTDLTAFSLEKARDFAFVDSNLEKAIARLAAAWLMMTSIQRDAERVTAEEWRILANELDGAMGGLYSELAQGFQRHVIRRFLVLHEEDDDKIPPLPKDVISVGVVTGIDAMGRNEDNEALARAGRHLKEVFGEAIGQSLNQDNYTRRVLTGEGIKADGLVKSPQQVQGEKDENLQDMQNQTILEAAAGPVAKAGAEGLAAVAVPAIQQQMQQ